MFTPARIVVLDDNRKHLTAIEQAIRDLGSSCVCLEYDSKVDPPEGPFARARLIFMDLQLRDNQFNTDFRAHFGEIQRLLTKLIKPGAGPYLLILWTAKPERVTELETYLEKNLYPGNPHTRPVKLLGMSKEKFIDLGTGDAKDPKVLKQYVTEQLESVPALAALLTWETEIVEASDRVVADVLRLASAAPVDGRPDVAVALRRLTTAAVGAPNVSRDPRAAIHSALFPLLEDHVQYEAVMPSAGDVGQPAAPADGAGEETNAGTRDQAVATTTEGPTDQNPKLDEETSAERTLGPDEPNGEPADGATTKATAETAETAEMTIWDAALAGTSGLPALAREQAASLNAHLHLGGASTHLTATVWGAVCELEDTIDWTGELGIGSDEKYRKHILGCIKDQKGNPLPAPEALHLFQIRIGASCDYAQKTDGPIPFVITAFVPLSSYPGNGARPLEIHRLANDSTAWLSPVLDLPGHGAGHLVADPRYVRSRGSEATHSFVPVNRLREQLLMQLIATVARHGDRPGIVYFEGKDPAP